MATSQYISKNLQRLRGAIRNSRQALKIHRQNRIDLIKQFVGKYFGDDGAAEKVPLNLLELAVQVYLAQLAANAPGISITTGIRSLKGHSKMFQLRMNHLISKEIHLGATLESWVLDAMFSPFGIIKVGVSYRAGVEIDGYTHDYGQPYADVVDLDDFVVDMTARRWDAIGFVGDRYELPLEYVLESGEFKNTDKLQAKESGFKDEEGEETAAAISRGEEGHEEPYRDKVSLCDVWIPEDNMVLTLPWDYEGKPLKERDWDGPERGPYHPLKFLSAPAQVLGVPTLGVLRDLHEIANNLYRKGANQAMDAKTLGLYRGDAEQDAQRMIDAADREWVRSDNPGGTNVVTMGGIDQANFGLSMDARESFKQMAGGLDILGGLAPQSDTFGQDRLMNANASQRIQRMQQKVTEATQKVIEDLGFYVWQDPVERVALEQKIPKTDASIMLTWGPEVREADDFIQMHFDLVPYSMVLQTPKQKSDTVLAFVMNVLLPALPYLGEQQIGLDWRKIVEVWSRGNNMESEMQDVLIDLMPNPDAMERGVQGKPRQSPATTRTNVRINRAGATPQGKAADTIAQLMGATKQGSEQAGMYRSMG